MVIDFSNVHVLNTYMTGLKVHKKRKQKICFQSFIIDTNCSVSSLTVDYKK